MTGSSFHAPASAGHGSGGHGSGGGPPAPADAPAAEDSHETKGDDAHARSSTLSRRSGPLGETPMPSSGAPPLRQDGAGNGTEESSSQSAMSEVPRQPQQQRVSQPPTQGQQQAPVRSGPPRGQPAAAAAPVVHHRDAPGSEGVRRAPNVRRSASSDRPVPFRRSSPSAAAVQRP